MHRPGLWLATALALGVLVVGSVPAAAASMPKRTVAPVVSQHRVAGSLRTGVSLTERVTTAVPQSPSRTRTFPVPVTPLTFSDAYHMSQQQILINQDRASNGGLAPLAWSPCLANIALSNAQRIAAQGFLSHTNGPTLDMGCDPRYVTGGENIAYWTAGIDDAQANTMFMNSAPHRANILNANFRFVGTMWVVAPNGYGYVAVEFAG